MEPYISLTLNTLSSADFEHSPTALATIRHKEPVNQLTGLLTLLQNSMIMLGVLGAGRTKVEGFNGSYRLLSARACVRSV